MSTFNEIFAIQYKTEDVFDKLTPQERVFTYLMLRANLPFNKIAREQLHRYNNDIIDLFEFLYEYKEQMDNEELLKEIETYLVYLWSNHGIYFLRDHSSPKRTPKKLGFKHLDPSKLEELLQKFQYQRGYKHLFATIFDDTVDPELVVDNNIDKSGGNYYSHNFTEELYSLVSSEDKDRINAYFDVKEENGTKIPDVIYYSTKGKYGEELKMSVYWLTEALNHVKKYEEFFDDHLIKSLELLIAYLETGDEELFRQHSIEWLKIYSEPKEKETVAGRIAEYTLGFIETYHDPKNTRGAAGGDITVRVTNMDKLKPVLLQIENNLPLPSEYKRDTNQGTIMNVSINKIIFSSGHYGPLVMTAAYCLPNYEDIRMNHGSKQIIYKLPKNALALLNPELTKQFRTKAEQEFIDKFDPEDQITEDLWDVQVILHETLGHASGKLHKHTFKEGDELTIKGITYNIGDTIDVTDNNLSEFIKSDMSSLEELRAEINALYMSITEIDKLAAEGVYKDWVSKIGKEVLKEQLILKMCNHVFRRLMSQGENFKDIVGAHARANFVITNFLLEGEGIVINEEIKSIDGEDFHLLETKLIDFDKCFKSIMDLLQKVQTIKSTGDGLGCKELFAKYTKYPATTQQANLYWNYLMQNKKKMIGNIKATVRIYPNYVPIVENAQIVDVKIGKEMDIFDQNMYYKKMMLSTNLFF